MERKWRALLDRNPWFPRFLASGHEAGGWFFEATTDARRLRWTDHPPEEVRLWGGHRVTIADMGALGEFVYEQECRQVPLCLDGAGASPVVGALEP